MKIEIFNVEHGACALITCDNNARIMIDCGHNASTGWKPGKYLNSLGVKYLEQLVITNYDEDHVSGIGDLFDNVTVGWIARNMAVTPDHIRQLKTSDGMGPGIDRLIKELSHYLPPGSPLAGPVPIFQGVTAHFFGHSPAEFDDENNLSLLAKFVCNGIHIMFTGDMERAGWLKMLARPGFTDHLQFLDIFIAPHHGRYSGWCENIFQHCEPTYVVVSDKSLAHESQETCELYRSVTKGGPFDGEHGRKFITTRSDGDLVIEGSGAGFYFKRAPRRISNYLAGY
jgi:beta-lactamase superfamily II metal-dependent hydrolase